jgi:indole-3-glycerol phosphate synthase
VAANILERIVQTKRKEVADAKLRHPLEELQSAVAKLPRPKNFFTACSRPPRRLVNVIAEIKRSSPSAGALRPDLDPATIARTYAAAGVNAISVLTDREYFGGSLDDLRAVRAAVDVPLLRKDFIIDPYQVYEAREAGADCVLLIAACLKPSEIMDLLILASSLQLTCLLEVHEMDELLQVRSAIGFPHPSYGLLGINNRNLKTLQIDLNTTLRLSDMVEDKRTLVSESGIRTRQDVERLARAGVNTVLIGETLMRSPDISAKLEELFGAVK